MFERWNKSITLNVLGYMYNDEVYPLRISRNIYKRRHRNCRLVADKNEEQHYSVVKKLSRLLYSQTTKHHGERFYCLRCFNGFNSTNKDLRDMISEFLNLHPPHKLQKQFALELTSSVRQQLDWRTEMLSLIHI